MAESFALIEREMGPTPSDPSERAVVKRIIHASADFEYLTNIRFGAGSIAAAITALRQNAAILVDVEMLRAGIRRSLAATLEVEARCAINEPETAAIAAFDRTTRSAAGIRRLAARYGDGAVVAIGNAPTAVEETLRLVEREGWRPACIVGIPVGFVGVIEAKRALMAQAQVPFLTSLGPKGGTAVYRPLRPNAFFELAGGFAMSTGERPPFELVRGHSVPPRNPQGTREGYTTGACAAAGTHAACLLLRDDARLEIVNVPSPLGFDIVIPINRLAFVNGVATAGVIKDGGDDPDVTHGAEVVVAARWLDGPGLEILGGPGVGTITQPGLELPPGSPAINPIPRMMIKQSVAIALGAEEAMPGIGITISIPRGEELAKKTLNARLGIVGGLSILGTTGIVRPMSTASWRASVLQSIDVAAANSIRHIVLTTGGRTERFAEQLLPELPEMAFVQMGIFSGESLKRAVTRGVPRLTICGMVGKLAKLAAGQMQTHVAGGGVDLAFLAQVAKEAGASPALVEEIARANTARHAQEIIMQAGIQAFYRLLAEKVVRACASRVAGALEIEAILFDFDGAVLARASECVHSG